MHAVFLYQAIAKGMDMGIVNPSTSVLYETLIEASRSARRCYPLSSSGRFRKFDHLCTEHASRTAEAEQHVDDSRSASLGRSSGMGAGERHRRLFEGRSGWSFEAISTRLWTSSTDRWWTAWIKWESCSEPGRCFFRAGGQDCPYNEEGRGDSSARHRKEKQSSGRLKAGKIIFATVKGRCARHWKEYCFDRTCLQQLRSDRPRCDGPGRNDCSDGFGWFCLPFGLITPSLDEMAHVADEMEKAGLTISDHCGRRYCFEAAYCIEDRSALQFAGHSCHWCITKSAHAARLLNPATREAYIEQLKSRICEAPRVAGQQAQRHLCCLLPKPETSCRNTIGFPSCCSAANGLQVIPNVSGGRSFPYINWVYFFNAWKLNGRFSEIAFIHGCDVCRASWLSDSPKRRCRRRRKPCSFQGSTTYAGSFRGTEGGILQGNVWILPAYSGVTIWSLVIRASRCFVNSQLVKMENANVLQIMSFLKEAMIMSELLPLRPVRGRNIWKKFESEGDSYNLMLLQTLTDRLAEALAEYLHVKVRREFWGYAPDENLSIPDLLKEKYVGIRPAMGYPSIPDQKMNFLLDKLLHLDRIGVKLYREWSDVSYSICQRTLSGQSCSAVFHDRSYRRGTAGGLCKTSRSDFGWDSSFVEQEPMIWSWSRVTSHSSRSLSAYGSWWFSRASQKVTAMNLSFFISRLLSTVSLAFSFSLGDCFIYGSIAGLIVYLVIAICRHKSSKDPAGRRWISAVGLCLVLSCRASIITVRISTQEPMSWRPNSQTWRFRNFFLSMPILLNSLAATSSASTPFIWIASWKKSYSDLSTKCGILSPRTAPQQTDVAKQTDERCWRIGISWSFFNEYTLKRAAARSIPFHLCTGMAHVLGVAEEAEANLYAYLICTFLRISPAFLRFSVCFHPFWSTFRGLYGKKRSLKIGLLPFLLLLKPFIIGIVNIGIRSIHS